MQKVNSTHRRKWSVNRNASERFFRFLVKRPDPFAIAACEISALHTYFDNWAFIIDLNSLLMVGTCIVPFSLQAPKRFLGHCT